MTDQVTMTDSDDITTLMEQHRRELHVHCYRMLGSFDDAEDAVQDTFLRAWRYRESRKEDAPLRPWLYQIATNACLDAIARDKRRAVVNAGSETPDDVAPNVAEVTWLQPYPDALLEAAAPREAEPDAVVVTKETIELAFLAVIQLLTPPQRADSAGNSARKEVKKGSGARPDNRFLSQPFSARQNSARFCARETRQN